MDLNTLFSPKKIGNVQIKNRIVRSATFEGRATGDGYVTDQLIDFYDELARGGTGLIITGLISIDPSGTALKNQACLYDDDYISGQKKLVDAVHEHPGVRICAHISHAGRQSAHPKHETVGPSPVEYAFTRRIPRELTVDEIREHVEKFVSAGRRAYESGYDMVQIQAAHGWLLSNFISPHTNKRTDEYGGNTERRTRILVDIYHKLREEVGDDFPIIIKLQTQDFLPEGLTLDEGKEIARIIIDTGYDAIEASGGSGDTMFGKENTYPSLMIKKPEEENYFLSTAEELKPITRGRPIILMGGIRNPLSAEKILREKSADFIAMSRPLIYEPDLPNRWKNGDLSPVLCTSCNECYRTIYSGPLYCAVKMKLEKKRQQG
jgi:2,4-dienoyl-CoA reductase-like NADH-dependent reductase (Old Yellow Enzyme family)